MVPQQYEVTRILKDKGLVNDNWAGIETKPMKAEIMLKSHEVAERTLLEHHPDEIIILRHINCLKWKQEEFVFK